MLAQTPTADGSGGWAGFSRGSGGGQVAPARSGSDEAGGLPFTGLELGVLAAVGAGLVGTGIVVRRAVGESRRPA
jgi:hypothetical protein